MATNIPLSQIMGKMQSRRAMSAGSQHYGRRRLAAGHLSGYGPATEAAWQTTPDTYVPPTAATSGGGGTGGGGGGTGGGGTDITAAYEEAAMKLAQALRGVGIDWTRTAGQAYAPPASLIGGTGWKRIQNMPSLYTLMLQARAAAPSGQPAPDYLAEIGQFQHTAPAYSGVNYGW